ncbi:MAG TPA: hypothetical protein VMS09_05565 [Paenibacillus sp.]|uniref:hypothetical protein n=1 Tax=Paenibacillus sp. TaxID=58172 RepID=UPI002CB79BD1|nr:hypothetical protein [Paenibacillus sp.]HUC91488.1 hypothetical protein [Paenibacillus sp.]
MKTAVYDPSGRMERYFPGAESVGDLTVLTGLDAAEYGTVIINGWHAGKPLRLDYDVAEALWRFVEQGGLLYGEMVECVDFPSSRLFGFRQDFPATFRRLEKLKSAKENVHCPGGSLLEWNGPFLTGFHLCTEVLLEIGAFGETHRSEGAGQQPALMTKTLGSGRVVYAAIPLFANEQPWSLRPYGSWAGMLSLLAIEYGLPCRSPAPLIGLRKQSVEAAVGSGVRWFTDSGIMPDHDGSGGIYENIHSCRGDISRDVRPDCNVQTALMFHLYGRYTGDARWSEVSANIVDFLFRSGLQDDEAGSPTYGFWKWYRFPADKPDQIFSDDNAWVALVLLYLYRQTGIEAYKTRGLMTAEALWDTQNRLGLRREVLLGGELRDKGKAHFAAYGESNMNPHFQSVVHAAFIQAYLVTNDRKYVEKALKGTHYLLEHREKLTYMYSKTSGSARFLLALSHLYAVTGDKKIEKGLYEVFDYLKLQRHASGGIEEADNPDPERYGKEDAGVFLYNGEGISDQLYTNNFIAMNGWEAWKATRDESFFGFHDDIAGFMASIQIVSDLKAYNGGWFRAYDLNRQEYFGNNGDTGWGPYCIESGWTNGIAVSGLLLKLLDSSLLD